MPAATDGGTISPALNLLRETMMNFLLLIVAFNGQTTITYHKDATACETALTQATDLGQYKYIKDAKCINLQK